MNLEQWVTLEQRLRKAQSVSALRLLLVNSLQLVLPCAQSILFEQVDSKNFKVNSLSHVSEVNHQSPVVRWIVHSLAPWLTSRFTKPSFFQTSEVPHSSENDSLKLPYGLYLPLNSSVIGNNGLVLWFNKEQDASLPNVAILITETVIHAWERLVLRKNKKSLARKALFLKKRWGLFTLGLLLLLFIINISENTIAPAEVIPLNPVLVTPSINGTIHVIEVKPNQSVKKGQLLVRLDDITLRNQMEEAQKNLQVADQRYLKAYHHAYTDNSQAQNSLQEMSVLQEEKEQAQLKLTYQKLLLERTEIKSPIDGVALFADPKDWLGKPVRTGEKIMLIANPNDIELAFWINMDNMLEVNFAHPINFFSNENPAIHSAAEIQYINPIAEARPDGVIAYYGVAHFSKELALKLGEQGVVKIYGKKVSLFYYITRRPFRYIRQHLGI